MSKPSFSQIAELFQLGLGTVGEDRSDEPKKVGKTAEESRALGRSSLADGDYQQAIDHFRKVIEQREGTDPQDHLDLASALAYSDQAPAALRQYLKALKAGESADPLVGIADLYHQQGRNRDALEKMEAALAAEPENAYLHVKFAELLLDSGFKKRALAVALKAVILKPEESYFHFRVAELQVLNGLLQDALGSYRAAIELSPGDDFLYLRAAAAFWRLGRQAEAIKSLRLASDLDPDKPMYSGLLALLLEKDGQLEEAAQIRVETLDRYDQDLIDRFLAEIAQPA